MPKRYVHVTIRPNQGGALVASPSADVAGSTSYTKKLNWRRDLDGELRREGYELFNPASLSSVGNQPLRSEYPVRMLHQFPTPDGKYVLVAAAGDKLYRFDYVASRDYMVGTYGAADYVSSETQTYEWKVIASGLRHLDMYNADGTQMSQSQGAGYRWECVSISGYLFLNNGIDLPLVYRDGWDSAEPLYGLREMGFSHVGTISEFGNRLVLGDVTTITDGLDELLNSTDPYGNVLTHPLGPHDSALNPTGNGNITIKRTPYSIVWSSQGSPHLFGQIVKGAMSSGSNEFICDHKVSAGGQTTGNNQTFHVGSEVLVAGGDTGGADLGTDSSGARLKIQSIGTQTIGGVEKLVFTLSSAAAANGTSIRLYSEEGAGSGYSDFPEDGSAILKMSRLADKLVVYRGGGYFYMDVTNKATAPFTFESRYTGPRTAILRNTIISLGGKSHYFAGTDGVYELTRASVEPRLVGAMEIGPEWWSTISQSEMEFVYSVDNPITREIFFCYPPDSGVGTVAYDYTQKTISEIDVSFTAGTEIRKPRDSVLGPEEKWFIMGVFQGSLPDGKSPVGALTQSYNHNGGIVVRYGRGPNGYEVYNRMGSAYTSNLTSGMIDFQDTFSDKEMRSYALQLASNIKPSSGNLPPAKVTVYTAYSVAGTKYAFGEDGDSSAVALNDLEDENTIPLFLRAPYYQDEIIVEGKDNPIKIVGRTFEVSRTDDRSATQVLQQGQFPTG